MLGQINRLASLQALIRHDSPLQITTHDPTQKPCGPTEFHESTTRSSHPHVTSPPKKKKTLTSLSDPTTGEANSYWLKKAKQDQPISSHNPNHIFDPRPQSFNSLSKFTILRTQISLTTHFSRSSKTTDPDSETRKDRTFSSNSRVWPLGSARGGRSERKLEGKKRRGERQKFEKASLLYVYRRKICIGRLKNERGMRGEGGEEGERRRGGGICERRGERLCGGRLWRRGRLRRFLGQLLLIFVFPKYPPGQSPGRPVPRGVLGNVLRGMLEIRPTLRDSPVATRHVRPETPPVVSQYPVQNSDIVFL